MKSTPAILIELHKFTPNLSDIIMFAKHDQLYAAAEEKAAIDKNSNCYIIEPKSHYRVCLECQMLPEPGKRSVGTLYQTGDIGLCGIQIIPQFAETDEEGFFDAVLSNILSSPILIQKGVECGHFVFF